HDLTVHQVLRAAQRDKAHLCTGGLQRRCRRRDRLGCRNCGVLWHGGYRRVRNRSESIYFSSMERSDEGLLKPYYSSGLGLYRRKTKMAHAMPNAPDKRNVIRAISRSIALLSSL